MSEPKYQERPPPSVDPTALTTQALLREIASLKELLTALMEGHSELDKERFREIEERFVLIERQRIEQKKDTTTAIDAALAAQKETTVGIGSKVEDVKERVGRIESARSEQRASVGSVVGIVGAAVAVVVVVLALYAAFHTSSAPVQPTVVTLPTVTTP